MKPGVLGCTFMLIVFAATLAVAKGPEVDLVDNKLSINAEAISLSRLLQLVDLATGMKSKVPPELANRNLSVRFSNLDLTDGLRKMFQGQPFDYVVVQGQGIIVKSISQPPPSAETAPAPAAVNPPPPVQSFDQPFVQDFPPGQVPPQIQAQPQVQPQPMVQTPFGPIPNPRAQQPQQPNVPVTVPAQQNTLFPNQLAQPNQLGQPPAIGQPVPGFPTAQPNNANPFGTPVPFGTPNAPGANQNNPNNGLFGTVPVFGTPGTQQR
jgi:hypothetical protein